MTTEEVDSWDCTLGLVPGQGHFVVVVAAVDVSWSANMQTNPYSLQAILQPHLS